MAENKLQLFAIDSGAETDWIAAHTEDEARQLYINEYGLSESDVDDVTIHVVGEPDKITVYSDDIDAETEEPLTATAAEVMSKMTKAGLVASTVDY